MSYLCRYLYKTGFCIYHRVYLPVLCLKIHVALCCQSRDSRDQNLPEQDVYWNWKKKCSWYLAEVILFFLKLRNYLFWRIKSFWAIFLSELFYWVQLNISTYQVPVLISDNLPPGFCENWELVWKYIYPSWKQQGTWWTNWLKIKIQFCLVGLKLVWTLIPFKTSICQSPQPVLPFLVNRNILSFFFHVKFAFYLQYVRYNYPYPPLFWIIVYAKYYAIYMLYIQPALHRA